MAPLFGYWDIRGLAQPIRLLLAQAGVDVEERRYRCGPPPNFDPGLWGKEKYSLGLEFPNLPYYIDGNVKITQSLAIMRHLARKHGMEGKDETEKIRVDMTEQQFVDIRTNWARLCYNPKFEQLKANYVDSMHAALKAVSDFLGSRKFFAGDTITHADFIAYEMLDQHLFLDPNCLTEFPNLKGFVARIEALPRIAAYMKSDKYMKWPLNSDMASFGGRLQKMP